MHHSWVSRTTKADFKLSPLATDAPYWTLWTQLVVIFSHVPLSVTDWELWGMDGELGLGAKAKSLFSGNHYSRRETLAQKSPASCLSLQEWEVCWPESGTQTWSWNWQSPENLSVPDGFGCVPGALANEAPKCDPEAASHGVIPQWWAFWALPGPAQPLTHPRGGLQVACCSPCFALQVLPALHQGQPCLRGALVSSGVPNRAAQCVQKGHSIGSSERFHSVNTVTHRAWTTVHSLRYVKNYALAVFTFFKSIQFWLQVPFLLGCEEVKPLAFLGFLLAKV